MKAMELNKAKRKPTKFMDRLPTVASCCFCCFLRAGTVIIGLITFVIGLIFAPNIHFTSVAQNHNTVTETGVQVLLGVLAIVLCIISVLLIAGALCNLAILLLIYQWGLLILCSIVLVLYIILAMVCFIVHENSAVTGSLLFGIGIVNCLVCMYFVIVINSLRISLTFVPYTSPVPSIV